MADFSSVVADLQAERRSLLARIQKIDTAISALAGVGREVPLPRAKRGPGRPPKIGKKRGRPKGFKMSEEAKAKMRAAAKKRWATIKASNGAKKK